MELVVQVPTTGLILALPILHPSFRVATKSLLFPLNATISHERSRTFLFSSNDSKTATLFVARASSSPPSSVSTTSRVSSSSASECSCWIVVMETPPGGLSSKPAIIDYYVDTLARVLGSKKEAQMCIYDVSWQMHFGFCCDIDEEASLRLASLPGVLSVKPDKVNSANKNYIFSSSSVDHLPKSNGNYPKFCPPLRGGNSEYWLVQMEKPKVEVVSKAQIVDYYAHTLTKVLGNEKDAQVSIYNISWEKEFGFCCQIDKESAQELAYVPGVLSVRPDENFNSDNKDYRGIATSRKSTDFPDSSETNQTPKTKRLFVTGLSFYTSEKTLRAAFEGYGELVEVKIIMDKISKRSKGYAFIEYTTEDAASAALREMNGKIINGWMIVVDVAKTNPPRNMRGRSQQSSPPAYSN